MYQLGSLLGGRIFVGEDAARRLRRLHPRAAVDGVEMVGWK